MARRANLCFLVDCLALAAFVLLVTSGLLMRYVLPPGSHGLSVWGWGRHSWGDLHFWIAVVFLALVAVHLWLHWRWIVCLVQGRARSGSRVRVLLAAVALAGLVAAAAAPLFAPVVDHPGGGHHDGEQPGRGYRGGRGYGAGR